MLDQALAGLNIQPEGLYIDATYGRGGHTRAILSKLNSKGRLIVMDKDEDACQHARKHFVNDYKVCLLHSSFTLLARLARTLLRKKVSGILFDLGLSSPQLADTNRGFSFQQDGTLDMRMDTRCGKPVSNWLNQASEHEIAQVIRRYGEERYANTISRKIVKQRPLTRTHQLANIISSISHHPDSGKHKLRKTTHCATKTFMALRIFINHELEELRAVIAAIPNLLKSGGRLVILSFHSLEDRIVKHYLRDQRQGKRLPRDFPIKDSAALATMRDADGNPRLQMCSSEEKERNPRARSARLRIAQRI